MSLRHTCNVTCWHFSSLAQFRHVCFVCLFLSISLGADCESFWDTHSLMDNCYQFNFQATLSWEEARTSCKQQGAELLSISKVEEQSYINGERLGGYGNDNGDGGWDNL